MADKVRLGVSACLVGQRVRYNGEHAKDRYVTDVLGPHVEFVPVCPEVEVGFPVPRETLRLEGSPSCPRLMTTQTKVDHTVRMMAWAQKRVDELEPEGLCGFIFKSGSPSSGMDRVKVYNAQGIPNKTGRGLFARALMDRFPLLPVEDEGRLHDEDIRENFVERIFALKRWRDLGNEGLDRAKLIRFHTQHKLQIMSHSPKHYRAMGKWVAEGKGPVSKDARAEYERLFMETLRLAATPAKHVNVLQHMMGYFKKILSSDEKVEMLEVIESFRQGDVPLIVPVTLVNHYVRKHDQAYLKDQFYLHPHPMELRLRNHA